MEVLDNLITELKTFPGVGSKSARRIAFHLLKQDPEELGRIGGMISGLKDGLCTCSSCGNISDKDPCDICTDPLRDKNTLCIVEDIEALSAFEQAKIYDGLYHVLGCRIAPLEGEDLTDEAAEFLVKHISELEVDEVIIATNPRVEGEMAFYTLLGVLNGAGVHNVTRLAFGLPVGGSIEFADSMTLHTALKARGKVS